MFRCVCETQSDSEVSDVSVSGREILCRQHLSPVDVTWWTEVSKAAEGSWLFSDAAAVYSWIIKIHFVAKAMWTNCENKSVH